jgi:hypothetical protein
MDTYKVTNVSNATIKLIPSINATINHIPCSLFIFAMTTFDLLPPSRNVAHNIKNMLHVIVV